MTRILLVGKNGQIGWELLKSLQHIATVFAPERSELDITSRQDVVRVFDMVKPDIIINATGYNDVNSAEINKKDAVAVNVEANAFMAATANQLNSFYLTYSSDYVFDGEIKSPYLESDMTNPLNVYGQTKLDGETVIINSGVKFIILRTSSVFSLRRPCFLSKFLRQVQFSDKIQVRSDLVSSPTSAQYLAEITTQIISKGVERGDGWLSERNGIYHLAGIGAVSRFEWAQEIRDILNLNIKIIPVNRSDYPIGADRPIYSALNSSKFFDTFHLKPATCEQMLKSILDGLL